MAVAFIIFSPVLAECDPTKESVSYLLLTSVVLFVVTPIRPGVMVTLFSALFGAGPPNLLIDIMKLGA